MSALDTLADKAQAAAERLAREGGIKSKLAEELADDAEFLRKLKPELIKRRARGEAPTDGQPGEHDGASYRAAEEEAPAVPPRQRKLPKPRPRAQPRRRAQAGGGGGPNPFVVIGAALVLGVAVAKWIDWRGHAHPRW